MAATIWFMILLGKNLTSFVFVGIILNRLNGSRIVTTKIWLRVKLLTSRVVLDLELKKRLV